MSVHKRHFLVLDGMRGVAALGVCLYHIGHWTDRLWLAPHGGMAVDFFFCLSGFVLAYAYGEAIALGMSFARFATVRIVRLYPLIALGILIGAIYIFAHGFVEREVANLPALGTGVVLGLLMLPYFHAPEAVGGPLAYPINGPQWSLFFEFAVNFAWLTAFRVLTARVLIMLALASTVAMLFFPGGDRGDNFFAGVPRVVASFALGLWLFEYGRHRFEGLVTLHPTLLYGALFGLLLLPSLDPGTEKALIAPVVLLLMPALVLAGSRIEPAGIMKPVSRFLGDISYPLYALHYPVFCWINGALQYLKIKLPAPIEIAVIVGGAVGFSWIALKFFDIPVRAWLSRRKMRTASAPSQA